MCNNGCNSQVCPRYESSQNFVQTERSRDNLHCQVIGVYSSMTDAVLVAVEHGCCITEMTELTDRRPANSQALSANSCAACESANATGASEADLLRADLHRENACDATECA
jgi:hypothetical protein